MHISLICSPAAAVVKADWTEALIPVEDAPEPEEDSNGFICKQKGSGGTLSKGPSFNIRTRHIESGEEYLSGLFQGMLAGTLVLLVQCGLTWLVFIIVVHNLLTGCTWPKS